MDGDPSAANGLEHHKVIHIPMEDRGQPKLGKVVNLEAQWTSEQMELARDLH